MLKSLKFVLIISVFINSCSSKKDIYYLQVMNSDGDLPSVSYYDYELKIDDVLKIDVNSENPELSQEFNPNVMSNFAPSKDVYLYNGYQVNSQGTIDFPSLGKIYVEGLSVIEVRDKIYNLIQNGGFLANPIVDVKLINLHFTILGEVSKPGRYNFFENNFNIFDAIGMAGDLTINGEREGVKVLREVGNNKEIFEIDLTNINTFENKAYQIISGDIIIVNQNSSRVKNAGIIGNSGTLLSLLSFILSSIIVINAR